MSKTLALIKPNITKKNQIGKIINRIEDAKFNIIALKTLDFTNKVCEEFYAEHIGKPFYQSLVDFMSSGKVVALILETEGDAITKWRDLMGATDPQKAHIASIRYSYADNLTENATHGSDSEASFLRESSILFPEIK